MTEHRGAHALPPGTAVCIGAFDGFHRGHQALLQRARSMGSRRAVVTFDPHPAKILAPTRAPRLLLSPTQRLRVCAALGIDDLVLLPFDAAMAAMEPGRFVQTQLVDGLKPAAVVVGEDFRFGTGRSGGVDDLRAMLADASIPVSTVDKVIDFEGRPADWAPGRKLSSSEIRAALDRGEVGLAGAMLGRWHAVAGTVRTGDKRGRTLGFPTANVASEHAYLPQPGVYATATRLIDSPEAPSWPSVANVGRNPTFTADAPGPPPRPALEVHVLDQDLGESLYERELEVSFIARLRDEQRFSGPAQLVAQIERDAAQARSTIDADALSRVTP